MKTMYCPFMDAQIDSETCLEISMVANGEETGRVRDDTLTVAMRDKKRKKTCMHCKWHRVYCPVIEERIDGTTCLEICLVADEEISESILADIPLTTVWNREQKEKCLHCKWHGDMKD